MKKQFALIIISLMIFVSSLGIGYRTLPLAHATYVEGPITRDTIWTLVDSPFILSNDVVVDPTATLTIEPGVQVRFGGAFSIIVDGQIIANGADDKPILFTTNDPTDHILWNTITISGSRQSLLSDCIVEFASNGTTLQGGNVNIQKSTIRNNLENGIVIHSGTIVIQESKVVDNVGNAITIDGNGQVDVRSNTIQSNKNGLTLSSQASGAIFVFQNNISSNTEAGVILETNTFAGTNITENNVSSNGFGFSIKANASTYLTRNYVANNTVGLYYSGQSSHRVEFNDIFNNDVGMKADPSEKGPLFVDATHNFWGDLTGPEHDSLTPYAKANSVVSNGTNIDFLPFLMHPFGYSNNPPTAVLWTDKLLVAPYQTITFVGTDSHDDGSIWQYLVDFNDGVASGWTTLSLFNHSYSLPGTYTARLLVQDDAGSTSSLASATINVQTLTPLETSVYVTDSIIPFNERLNVTAFVSTAGNPLANAQVTMLSVRGGTFEPQTGVTDQNGYFTTTFTTPNVTQTTDVRIIARASMTNYADGSDYKYIRVLAPLRIQMSPAITSVLSEETVPLNVEVTNLLEEPIEGVSLNFSCTGGNLSKNTEATDSYGRADLFFTAPTVQDSINVTLTIRASKTDYADTEGQFYIPVEPKKLDLEITATPSQVSYLSGTDLNIIVHATYLLAALENANVTVTASDGTLTSSTAMTDVHGNATFVLTTPEVTESSNVTFTAAATKEGYRESTIQLDIAVEPRTFIIQLTPATVTAGQHETLSVQVTCNETQVGVDTALITVAYVGGQPVSNVTDISGVCTFGINVPQTSGNQLNITLTADRIGYRSKQVTITLNVLPAAGGVPWVTIIAIVIPLVIVAVVVALIKMKVIVVSTKDEGHE